MKMQVSLICQEKKGRSIPKRLSLLPAEYTNIKKLCIQPGNSNKCLWPSLYSII